MSIDAMKQALEALEDVLQWSDEYSEVRAALRAAIEQAQEPVAWMRHLSAVNQGWDAIGFERAFDDDTPLYTSPQHPRYYTILTTGEDDNLEIIGLYVSDHPVDPTEWRTAFKKFNQGLQDEHEAIYQRHGGKLGYGHIPKAHEEYIAFMHKTHPLKPFLEKHGMKQLMYTELWTWGQP